LIQRKAKSGIFLSVLGFGDGNYQDATLEKLADKGNGNYAYIDSSEEAHKVLVQQASGTLVAVAKDVKIQLEFNPRAVESFRLIGYENRVLSHRDFNDDRKDAGEIGAGHTVTALYEVVPTGAAAGPADQLRYQHPLPAPGGVDAELLHINLRYKLPNEDSSQLIALPVLDRVKPMSADFRFAAAVAELGMLLRGSPHQSSSSYDDVLSLAEPSLGSGQDRAARSEFIDLVRQARSVTSGGR
jgi:Ca-activated chloride channel family protein